MSIMNPGHTLPVLSVLNGQPLQPRVQEQTSLSVGTEHMDDGLGGHSLTHSLTEKSLLGSSERHSLPRDRNGAHIDPETINPQTPPPARRSRGRYKILRGLLGRTVKEYMPVEEKPQAYLCKIEERLRPTIKAARKEKNQYSAKANWLSHSLNVAIALQVFLGALTTGLAAALSGRQTSIALSILGGMSTIVGSYLARMRGSNEPQLSITRVRDLDHFLRECAAFEKDHGHQYGTPENKLDDRLDELRKKFEELLVRKIDSDGQQKLSSPV